MGTHRRLGTSTFIMEERGAHETPPVPEGLWTLDRSWGKHCHFLPSGGLQEMTSAMLVQATLITHSVSGTDTQNHELGGLVGEKKGLAGKRSKARKVIRSEMIKKSLCL